jgi:hypothetical protein
LVNELNDLGTSANLGGLTPQQWLTTSSHLCSRVAVSDDGTWPATDASPQQERRIAQRNLVPFDVDLEGTPVSPAVDVIWIPFLVSLIPIGVLRPGDPLQTITIQAAGLRAPADLLLALPLETLERNVPKQTIAEFERIDAKQLPRPVPFKAEHAVLAVGSSGRSVVGLTSDTQHLAGMMLGVRLDRTRLRVGTRDISVWHRVRRPAIIRDGPRLSTREVTIGGFTARFRLARGIAQSRVVRGWPGARRKEARAD